MDTRTGAQQTGVGRRLQSLLKARGQSIREFASALEEGGVANSAYSSVFRYVKGEVDPPRAWIEDAAALLEVSAGWLGFGDRQVGHAGPLRGGDVELDRRVARAVGPGRGSTHARTGILAGLKEGLQAESIGEPLLVTLEAVFWRRWRKQEEHVPEDRHQDVHALAESVGRAAVAPLTALGINPRDLERWELEFFIPFMYGPLMQLAGTFPAEDDGHDDA